MALSPKTTQSLLDRGYSRRQISRIALGASAAIPFFNEFAMAQQGERRMNGGQPRVYDPEMVRITSNENPMGPCKEGLEALVKVAPMGWRYSPQGDNLDSTRCWPARECPAGSRDRVSGFQHSAGELRCPRSPRPPEAG